MLRSVYADIEAYYGAKLARYGATPLGVDWSCRATQELRFVQLLKICDFSSPFSLNDLGCGYGALLTYLSERHPGASVDYLGIDISPAMIRRARRLHRSESGERFIIGKANPRTADYCVASGIMNVKLDHSLVLWEGFIVEVLCELNSTSRRGFAVNFMAEAPPGASAHGLYRTSPEPWLRYCRRDLGCSVELLTGYGLREFTILARHQETEGPIVPARQCGVSP